MRRRIVALSVAVLALVACAVTPSVAAPPPAQESVSVPDVVAPLMGAVVNIAVRKAPDTAARDPSQASTVARRPEYSLGSGFIIDPDGYIVTNRHVVAGGYGVTVTLNDDRQFPAKVLATNSYPDLALLKIDAGGKLPTVRFGDSNALRLGETVIAIGNPLGLSGSISVGVVSALNRNIRSTVIDDFIQTDAAINHGNSGGPLFNLRGEVVGVNWALISDTTGSVGLGLAIPSRDAALVIDDLRRSGRLNAGFPGMGLQAVSPALAAALGLSQTDGGVITEIWPGSGAEQAGLRVGDVVLQIGDERTSDVRALLRESAHFPPGTIGRIKFWRAGRIMTVGMRFSTFPPQFDPAGPPAMPDRGPRVTSPPLGLWLAAITEPTRRSLDLASDQQGVAIVGVAANSAGADAGLSGGDVIERVQDAEVASPDAVIDDLRQARAAGHVTVPILVRSLSRLQWMVLPLGEL